MTTTYASLYGRSVYGSILYGSTAFSYDGIFRWIVEVDWNGDGVFDGWNEADRLTDIQCNRGRKNFIQPNGQGFYPVSIGVLHMTLDNHDGRYDAWNTSSPLYPNIAPGKDVRVRVVDNATETTYNFFYGIISDIAPSGYGANAIVKISVEDGLRFLRNVYDDQLGGSFTVAFNVSPATAIFNAVEAGGWTDTYNTYNIDTSAVVLKQYIRDGRDIILDNANASASAALGYFFITTNNYARYIDRASTSTSIGTYDESVIKKDIGNPFPFLNKRNIAKIFWSTYASTTSDVTTLPADTTFIKQKSAFVLNTLFYGSTNADDAASILLNFLETPHKTPIIQISNRASYQFIELFDKITLNAPALGISNEDFRVGGIEHHGTPQDLTTVMYLEPFIST